MNTVLHSKEFCFGENESVCSTNKLKTTIMNNNDLREIFSLIFLNSSVSRDIIKVFRELEIDFPKTVMLTAKK